MKKSLKKVILIALFSATSLFAGDAKSLVGIELGYNSFDIAGVDSIGVSVYDDKVNFGHAGIKIGAELADYRVFVSTRYAKIDDFDYAYLMGVEFQYLINFSKKANLFIGLNTGYAQMEYKDSNDFIRRINDPYVGGDLGINYLLDEKIDLELGVRLITLDADNLKNDETYSFESITTAYMGVIYKF